MFDFIILRLGTVAEGAAIIPISAQMKYNVDAVCEYISKKIPVPVRDFTSQPRLIGEKHTVSSPFSDLAGSTIIVVITMGVISFYFNFQLFDLLMSTNLAAKCKTWKVALQGGVSWRESSRFVSPALTFTLHSHLHSCLHYRSGRK